MIEYRELGWVWNSDNDSRYDSVNICSLEPAIVVSSEKGKIILTVDSVMGQVSTKINVECLGKKFNLEIISGGEINLIKVISDFIKGLNDQERKEIHNEIKRRVMSNYSEIILLAKIKSEKEFDFIYTIEGISNRKKQLDLGCEYSINIVEGTFSDVQRNNSSPELTVPIKLEKISFMKYKNGNKELSNDQFTGEIDLQIGINKSYIEDDRWLSTDYRQSDSLAVRDDSDVQLVKSYYCSIISDETRNEVNKGDLIMNILLVDEDSKKWRWVEKERPDQVILDNNNILNPKLILKWTYVRDFTKELDFNGTWPYLESLNSLGLDIEEENGNWTFKQLSSQNISENQGEEENGANCLWYRLNEIGKIVKIENTVFIDEDPEIEWLSDNKVQIKIKRRDFSKYEQFNFEETFEYDLEGMIQLLKEVDVDTKLACINSQFGTGAKRNERTIQNDIKKIEMKFNDGHFQGKERNLERQMEKLYQELKEIKEQTGIQGDVEGKKIIIVENELIGKFGKRIKRWLKSLKFQKSDLELIIKFPEELKNLGISSTPNLTMCIPSFYGFPRWRDETPVFSKITFNIIDIAYRNIGSNQYLDLTVPLHNPDTDNLVHRIFSIDLKSFFNKYRKSVLVKPEWEQEIPMKVPRRRRRGPPRRPTSRRPKATLFPKLTNTATSTVAKYYDSKFNFKRDRRKAKLLSGEFDGKWEIKLKELDGEILINLTKLT